MPGAAATVRSILDGPIAMVGLSEKEWSRWKTIGALCAVSIIKGADIQLLPASFRAMEVDLQLEPYALGALALCQGLACAASGPFWGNLVDSGFSRKLLLFMGCFAWGACTLGLAFASGIKSMALLRIMNGASLAMLLPVVQSFVCDLCPEHERGWVFGLLFMSANAGQVVATLFTTPMSNQDLYGTDGWRIALAVVGLLSWAIMLVVPFFVEEEPRRWSPHRLGLSRELKKLWQFMQIPTFSVIILQGVFGTIPGAAHAFITMYFQYTGIPDAMCAMINAIHITGHCLGNLVGGVLGDALTKRFPQYGRPMTAQLSILLSLPFFWLIFVAVPRVEAMVGVFCGLLFIQGFVGSWVGPGCIAPVMCSIVPSRVLASAYAWELALVFCSGNTIGPMMVGFLSARVFGYKLSTKQVDTMDAETRKMNAEALGKSLFFSSFWPFVICSIFFTLMYFSYKKDKEAVEARRDEPGSSEEDEAAMKPTAFSRLMGDVNSSFHRISSLQYRP